MTFFVHLKMTACAKNLVATLFLSKYCQKEYRWKEK